MAKKKNKKSKSKKVWFTIHHYCTRRHIYNVKAFDKDDASRRYMQEREGDYVSSRDENSSLRIEPKLNCLK